MAQQLATYEQFQNEKIIPNLDGLRALSILLVMFHHIPLVTSTYALNLQQNGRLGVMLFFVISGFLITKLALKEWRLTGTFNIKDFYIRRSLRIFPLYYAVMLLVCLLVYGLNVYPASVQQEFTERLPSYLLYYSNLTGSIQGPFSLVWSLAVEEQFYLVFALLFFFLPVKFTMGLFFILTLLRLTMPFWGDFFADDHLLLVAFRYQEAIFLGVSLAFLMENRWFFYGMRQVAASYIVGTALVAALAIGFIFFSVERDPWLETVINMLFTLLVGVTALWPPLWGIGGPALSYVGKVSYGIYLFHTLVFYGIKKHIGSESWMVFGLGVPLTVCVAAISYTYFESYFIKMKRTFNPL